MEFIPTEVRLERVEMLPILRITAISPVWEEWLEYLLLHKLFDFIEMAEEYGWKTMELSGSEDMSDIKHEDLAIRVYVNFKNMAARDEAITKLVKELG